MKPLQLIFLGILGGLAISCSQRVAGPKGPDGMFEQAEYQEAISAYQKILEDRPNDPEVNYKIAESYRRSNRMKMASSYYETALSNGLVNDTARYYYAFALKAQKDYDAANEVLEALVDQTNNSSLANLARVEMQNLKELGVIQERNYYEISTAGPINTAAAEYSPMVSKGEIYFTSNRDDNKIFKTTGTPFSDIYKAKINGMDVDVTSVEVLGDLINTPGVNEGTITFTRDGNTVVFARGSDGGKKSAKEVNLYISRYRNGDWTEPELMTGINHPDFWDSSPAFNRSGRTIYFASNRPRPDGSSGGIDLYAASVDANGRFGNPRYMGNDINTRGDEMFPYVDDEGRLFFASSGHPGFGGLDLFVAERKAGKTSIRNLGIPVNSSDDDFSMIYTDRTHGFFSSNRDGGQGDDDIYAFIDNSPDRKIINYNLTLLTLTPDSITAANVALNEVVIKVMDNEEKVLQEVTTDENGSLTISVEPEKEYLLIGEKENFFTTRLSFSTIGETIDPGAVTEEVTNKDYSREMVLDRAEEGAKFVLENIFYDFDKDDIRSDAALELDKLVQFLQDNPEIKIELGSHTDSKGDDDYNMDLSRRRAESAVNYVVANGIAKNRIRARGYGESQPRASNTNPDGSDNPEGRQKNRRTEIKVFEYNKDTGKMEELKEIKQEQENPNPEEQ
ncbi:MAG: OmpA family protein [Cyclobacteriaceae bacterium]|nr:OmpA family protein [Cyclobacteriaceae bacterium]